MVLIPDELQERFNSAKRICVLTGAGISAESGVPTFRGKDGLSMWKGMPFEAISSATMVREDLDEVWAWFDFRRERLSKCRPNPGHIALAQWESRFNHFTLVTQNIDGLHAAAGSRDIIELHGNINRAYCVLCGKRRDIAGVPHEPDECETCDGRLRPDVVLFGEMLPEGAFGKAEMRAGECELFFVIGTSALVYPAASLPMIAKSRRAFLVEINAEETNLSELCDISLRGKAGEILPLIGG
jgi:NAD-dependent deacetylase